STMPAMPPFFVNHSPRTASVLTQSCFLGERTCANARHCDPFTDPSHRTSYTRMVTIRTSSPRASLVASISRRWRPYTVSPVEGGATDCTSACRSERYVALILWLPSHGRWASYFAAGGLLAREFA